MDGLLVEQVPINTTPACKNSSAWLFLSFSTASILLTTIIYQCSYKKKEKKNSILGIANIQSCTFVPMAILDSSNIFFF